MLYDFITHKIYTVDIAKIFKQLDNAVNVINKHKQISNLNIYVDKWKYILLYFYNNNDVKDKQFFEECLDLYF